jgi:thymidine kinase
MKFDTTSLPHIDRYFVGADRVMKRLADIADQSTLMMPVKYPPYNIKKVDEDRYVIELAVAGFGKADIDIQLQEGLLSIQGKCDSSESTEYLYKGIAERGFKREFTLADNVEVVGIDEAQFFDDNLPSVCNQLANSGIRVIVAGLDMDFKGEPFGPMPQLMAIAEYVTKVHAICMKTGKLANYSHRLTNNEGLVELGATENYQPLSREAYFEALAAEEKAKSEK